MILLNTGLFALDGVAPPEGGAFIHFSDWTIYKTYNSEAEAAAVFNGMNALARFLKCDPEDWLRGDERGAPTK